MKRIIVCDIDDVLALYTDAFIEFMHSSTLKREDIRGSFIEMGIPIHYLNEFENENLSTLKPIPESQRCIASLLQCFHVIVATSRNPSLDTLEWMKQCFPGIYVVFTKEKGDFCRSIGAYALIEDQAKYAEQFDNSFVLAEPWNVDAKCQMRGTWKEIADFLITEEKFRKYSLGELDV
jgi:5'(3')-deoxyribonucleotidase